MDQTPPPPPQHTPHEAKHDTRSPKDKLTDLSVRLIERWLPDITGILKNIQIGIIIAVILFGVFLLGLLGLLIFLIVRLTS